MHVVGVVHGEDRVLSPLIHLPRVRTDEEQALLAMANRFRRFPWEQFLIRWCASFHALTAVALVAFPYDMVMTEGTRPVLEIANRWAWAGVFLIVAVAVAYLHEQRPWLVQAVAWFTVVLVGGMWLTAFILAAFRSEGGALGLVVWPFLYGPWLIVAYLSLRKR